MRAQRSLAERARIWGPRRRAACEHRRPSLNAHPRGQQSTGQEQDPELGLINMKGRLYDPALRRFTTADPYVTDPLNPQGLNRYSYVQNNPMSFTDPSGFDCYDSLASCGQAQAAMAAQAAAQAQSQAMAMAAAQAAGLGPMYSALGNEASNNAGAQMQAQHAAEGARQGMELWKEY